ncbi:glyoxylate/hydroxypyruvate reductase A [Maritimibacter sp. DP1N21-5]|uniref:2-hydroxyacid dehydrogenase n=1 Tax=Maritimibacter sp. DP1N21-5 TaxID=2836867 RepID=UPI001C49442C|nr:glyoxylate/hydroxypyruvate reductase A [Maritimibacter sp. DP1N21-5]MBV7408600.1 glyoxylate/hydroxypyruvate reductase A [Maritimibacter sp. DP1N21-5]
MLRVQLLLKPAALPVWTPALEAALEEAGIEAALATDHAPETVDYVIYAPGGGPVDLSPYTSTKLVQGLWAGVESIIENRSLTQPYARMVGGGLTEGMVEWVTGHVLRHHLGMDRYITAKDPHWDQRVPPLAADRGVTILGLGVLGAACAAALVTLGFRVSGWSRREKALPGVNCHHGEAGLSAALVEAEILVLLLPATPVTTDLMNADTLAALPRGAVILNPGRGALINEDALLAALERGHIAHATLDTFKTEPLPAAHPFWTHPGVTITPHIASETRPDAAARVVAENIRRSEAGEPVLHLVDRTRGY